MPPLPTELALHIADGFDELDARTAYGLLRLRQQVFVVEQECVYLDLDERDLEPGAAQLWFQDPGGDIAATIRVLREDATEPGLISIGRVVTDPMWRGRGLAAALIGTALERYREHPVLIHAQAHLAAWYARFGFASCGDEFIEDGIPHLPMRLDR